MRYELLTSDGQRIALTEEEGKALERMLQWPEDLPAYDRLNSPTRIPEIDALFN